METVGLSCGCRKSPEHMPLKNEPEKEVEAMQTLTDDELWRVLHDGHVDMQTMSYKSQV